MGNVFRICDECRTPNAKTLTQKRKQIDPDAEIEVGCQSYCGPGLKRHLHL
ncbi:hypothetical protein HNQ94_002350 [Salirhabdus euzebyi]|uniref:DUF1450 domain-containing protein n=1 Tax=Salirhabdus euzebyi TaxID=394506 RepID=A0A841Q5Z4_9BACI|nr:hypothetical protein [Salirhabdus euzebyi]